MLENFRANVLEIDMESRSAIEARPGFDTVSKQRLAHTQ